jgi:MerR family gold-responsive transcriptional activator of gol and ges genes
MNIGDASKASKVSAKMIRYYEQIGLIPAADRTDAGYRTYSQADVHRLHFIRRARDFGFSVAEISNLLGLWHDKARQSADVKRLAQEHIAALDRRMEHMRQMAEALRTLANCCAGDERPDCPILEELQQPDAAAAATAKRTGAVARRQLGDATGKKIRTR